jgi:hypothetical protein
MSDCFCRVVQPYGLVSCGVQTGKRTGLVVNMSWLGLGSVSLFKVTGGNHQLIEQRVGSDLLGSPSTLDEMLWGIAFNYMEVELCQD